MSGFLVSKPPQTVRIIYPRARPAASQLRDAACCLDRPSSIFKRVTPDILRSLQHHSQTDAAKLLVMTSSPFLPCPRSICALAALLPRPRLSSPYLLAHPGSQGISLSALKNACKALGLGRWPYVRRKQPGARASRTRPQRPDASSLTEEDAAAAAASSRTRGEDEREEGEESRGIEEAWIEWYMGLGLDEDEV
eukprot:751117-Hanusia_phi.AAC.1